MPTSRAGMSRQIWWRRLHRPPIDRPSSTPRRSSAPGRSAGSSCRRGRSGARPAASSPASSPARMPRAYRSHSAARRSRCSIRVPGIWEQYHMEILAACAVVLLQAALIVLFIYERRHRHAAEVAARVTMSELTRLDRVAAAGELSASIAHEVNQPLAGIALRAGAARRWLGREPPDLDKVRSALEQIVSASHHASDIVKGIRAMFKKDTQVAGRVDINDVIVLVLQLTRVEVRKHDIDVRTQLAMPLPPVVGDAVQLQQVILNLVMNAVEAMHASPRRILRIKSELDKSGGVHVSVEDTGPGIDPSRLDRVFRPLYTTKATGMGMGLTICHSIIARHNGRIWVSPGSEGGSSFQFIVPTVRLEADAAVHGKVME